MKITIDPKAREFIERNCKDKAITIKLIVAAKG